MAFKSKEREKQYFKQYYRENKEVYAYYKRLEYWRNLYLSMIDDSIENIKGYSLEDLKYFVNAAREVENRFK